MNSFIYVVVGPKLKSRVARKRFQEKLKEVCGSFKFSRIEGTVGDVYSIATLLVFVVSSKV